MNIFNLFKTKKTTKKHKEIKRWNIHHIKPINKFIVRNTIEYDRFESFCWLGHSITRLPQLTDYTCADQFDSIEKAEQAIATYNIKEGLINIVKSI